MPEVQTIEHDILVIGAGGAGLSAAIKASASGASVGVVSKSLLGKAHTVMAEGGVAAALYRGDAFNARVITQWTCHGAPLVNGIGAPPSTPVLAIVRSNDPWYDAEHTKAQGGDCGSFIDNRPGSASIVADGQIHDVMSDRELFARILEFLGSHRS